MFKKLFLITFFLVSPLLSIANEQQDAVLACEKAEETANQYYKQLNKRWGGSLFCDATSRSKNQWNCVAQSLSNGNDVNFSMSQCFRTDPRTILIGTNEQKNATEICKQTFKILKNNPKFPLTESFCEYSGEHNSEEWNCVKKLIGEENDFNFASAQCFINTDAQRH